MEHTVFASDYGKDEITELFKMSHGLFIEVCKVLLKEVRLFSSFRDDRREEYKITEDVIQIDFWTTSNPYDIEMEVSMFLDFIDYEKGNYITVDFSVPMNRFLEVKEQVLRTNKRAKAAQLKFIMEGL